MRVLIWSELFWPHVGGAEVFTARLCRALGERGHEFAVATSHVDPPSRSATSSRSPPCAVG